MSLFIYVIDHDVGFAPNPFHGVCSLAACKPQIRKGANQGDVIVGTGSKPSGLAGQLIYWMIVDEILDFDRYWRDPRFVRKRPQMAGSIMQCHGDNIYHRDTETGEWIQEYSFHFDPPNAKNGGNLRRDTYRTDKVLLGREYAYFGTKGPKVPDEFSTMIPDGRYYRRHFPDDDEINFLNWLKKVPERGFVSIPGGWTRYLPKKINSDQKVMAANR